MATPVNSLRGCSPLRGHAGPPLHLYRVSPLRGVLEVGRRDQEPRPGWKQGAATFLLRRAGFFSGRSLKGFGLSAWSRCRRPDAAARLNYNSQQSPVSEGRAALLSASQPARTGCASPAPTVTSPRKPSPLTSLQGTPPCGRGRGGYLVPDLLAEKAAPPTTSVCFLAGNSNRSWRESGLAASCW